MCVKLRVDMLCIRRHHPGEGGGGGCGVAAGCDVHSTVSFT